jgi:diguanylate cyclase (GGDEF)-like protein
VPRSLGLVVTASATKLVAASAADAAEVYQTVLAELVEHFGADAGFLRYNDSEIGATRLVAEWPARSEVPDPDPFVLGYFTDSDPVVALAEHDVQPKVLRRQATTDDCRSRVDESPLLPATSMVTAPLVLDGVTTGMLGFAKNGDREWTPDEIASIGEISSLFAQLNARNATEQRLRYLAQHDELTGLWNRRALLAHLDQRLSAGQPGPVSALFFDLDRLKTINDYMGHLAGDSFIRVLAERLVKAAEDNDLIARLGGDEFVVIPASPMEADEAESLACRLQSIVSEHMEIDGEMLSRTASIGVAVGLPGRDSTSDLLHRADRAVGIAKSSGGNQIGLLSGDTTLNSKFRNDIELRLREAIESNSLVLQYLPEIDMRNGKVLATEALVRWQHPTRGLLPPSSFIGVAESINLAGELGRWVMRRACGEFSNWQACGVGRDAMLRINVSPVQLVTHGFVDVVVDTIDEFGLDRGSVCLEITEGVVVKDTETSLRTLNGLKDVGVHIAIDDFGTGYSVLSGLKTLPVDTLKIDKGFVYELGTNASDLAIVQSIIALADAFDLQLVAEGVETEAAAGTLLRHGCHRAQGFMLSPPVTADAMKSLLAKGRIPVRFSRNPYS